MRQQQNSNKNRMRGRGRKPSNNTNRNFESNGPDVKIRGNAAHIAEKYTTLARDALSSGDRVIAENYLQHAEHYNRIVLANNAAREEAQALQAKNQAERDGEQPSVEAGDASTDVENSAEENTGRNNRRPRRRDANGDGRREARSRKPDQDADQEGNSGESTEKAAEASTDSGDVGAEEAPKPRTRRTSRKKAEVPDNISQDAAGLPQGLLGDVTPRETASAED